MECELGIKDYLEDKAWNLIDELAHYPSVKLEPRTWEHLLCYAPDWVTQRTIPKQDCIICTDFELYRHPDDDDSRPPAADTTLVKENCGKWLTGSCTKK